MRQDFLLDLMMEAMAAPQGSDRGRAAGSNHTAPRLLFRLWKFRGLAHLAVSARAENIKPEAVIVLRVIAKDRKLDSFLFKKAGIIGAEDLKPKAFVFAFLFKGLLPFRQGADLIL
jgi:hypothetical protein